VSLLSHSETSASHSDAAEDKTMKNQGNSYKMSLLITVILGTFHTVLYAMKMCEYLKSIEETFRCKVTGNVVH
jgi:hypothetical protein